VILYYLDASAWVKRYYQESGTAWMQDLFAHNRTMACASLGLIEVMATSVLNPPPNFVLVLLYLLYDAFLMVV